jgi:hypothetical protein
VSEYAIHLNLSGTPEQIADRLEQIADKFRNGGFVESRAKMSGPRWLHGVNTASIQVDKIPDPVAADPIARDYYEKDHAGMPSDS